MQQQEGEEERESSGIVADGSDGGDAASAGALDASAGGLDEEQRLVRLRKNIAVLLDVRT